MTTKFCPLKMASHALEAPVMTAVTWYCEEEDCAWWNAHFGMCCTAVGAHLKELQATRHEEFGTQEWHDQASADLDDRALLEREE